MRIDVTKYLSGFIEDGEYIVAPAKNQFAYKCKLKRVWNLQAEGIYSIGLWFGDGYVRGNSVGLTNRNAVCLKAFQEFVNSVSLNPNPKFMSDEQGVYRVYFNSSLLRKSLQAIRGDLLNLVIDEKEYFAFLAGLVDADGTVMPYKIKNRSGFIKTTHGRLDEVDLVKKLSSRFSYGLSISKYRDRNAFDVNFTLVASSKLSSHLLSHLRSSHKKKAMEECLNWLTRR